MPILGFMPDASRARGNHRNVPPDPESAPNGNPDQLFHFLAHIFSSASVPGITLLPPPWCNT
ncbi:hypothetical protein Q5P01_006701 [Channa striata]|uniref:Uncharacterized protein n=1 Tax=Channa striata TaxID=64152 RepID=A0AA88NBG0_CHASR|nr:hypothetical protein Q5P01_006701 [Channa striata]